MTVSTLAPRARRRMVPPPPPDAVTQYALDVTAGRIVAGQLVRKACERHLADLADGHERGLVWDRAAAEKAIAFFPLLRHYKGEWGPRPGKPVGDPIVLEPWQQFVVGSAFGWKREDGTRRFRKVYLEVAKKNGKTLLAAGVGTLLAFFDGEPAAEVYSYATKRDQAKLSWNDAVQMVKKNPALAARIETLAGSLSDPRSASFFRPLGRDSDSDQGINVHGGIVDELHAHDSREGLDNLETATSARRQPMLWEITTAGVSRESVWHDERTDAIAVVEGRATDDSMLVLIYTLDEGDDPFDEAVWPKSNPNLGVSVKLDTMRSQAEAARRSPGRLAAYLRFRQNVPTQASTRWLSLDDWDACGDEPDLTPGRVGYGGLDIASSRDLAAFAVLFRRTIAGGAEDEPQRMDIYDLLVRFWCPEERVEERSRLDGIPYADWVRDGYLTATPGNVIDQDWIEREILELAETYQIAEIGYDRWNASALITRLLNEGATCVPISQTFSGLSAASKEFENLVISHALRHGNHPILRWMAGIVEVETDPGGHIRPSKRRSTDHIDGIPAGIMALHRWMANGEPAIWTAA